MFYSSHAWTVLVYVYTFYIGTEHSVQGTDCVHVIVLNLLSWAFDGHAVSSQTVSSHSVISRATTEEDFLLN